MTATPIKLATLAQQVLEAAQKAGADQADTVISRGESRSIEVRDGALEQAEVPMGLIWGCGFGGSTPSDCLRFRQFAKRD